jgi:hypothetical protein
MARLLCWARALPRSWPGAVSGTVAFTRVLPRWGRPKRPCSPNSAGSLRRHLLSVRRRCGWTQTGRYDRQMRASVTRPPGGMSVCSDLVPQAKRDPARGASRHRGHGDSDPRAFVAIHSRAFNTALHQSLRRRPAMPTAHGPAASRPLGRIGTEAPMTRTATNCCHARGAPSAGAAGDARPGR